MINIHSTLKEVISICGIESNESSFIQKQPTNLIINNLRELLSKGNICSFERFKEIISEIHNSKTDFHVLLEPVNSKYDLYLFSTPKSLIQIFLMISELSNFVIEILMEKVCELSQNNVDSDNQYAILCLSQFKWNIYNRNTDEIVDKLLDLGYITNNIVQNHLITIFPDICRGKSNEILAEKLLEWISINNNLISSSLATINKLNLNETMLKQIESIVTAMLDTASMNSLPAIVSFLIKRTDKIDQINLIDKIRENIEFDNLQTMFSSAVISTPIDYVDNESNSAIKLIESIKINLQFNPNLRKSWIKSISRQPDIVRTQSFDLIILILIYDEYKSIERNSIIGLIKSKISKNQFSSDTIDRLFRYHLSLMKPLYRSFLAIINAIIGTFDRVFLEFGRSVYLAIFQNPGKDFREDRVMEYLLVDIFVKPRFVIDGVLEILGCLAAENCLSKLRLFYGDISGLLSTTRFELTTGNQIYRIYSVLAKIAFQPPESSSMIVGGGRDDDNEPVTVDGTDLKKEIVLSIRRQLENPNFNVRKNGGIGSVAVMRYLSSTSGGATTVEQRRWNSESINLFINQLMMLSNPIDSSETDEIMSDDSEETSDNGGGESSRVVGTILKSLLSYYDTVPQLIVVVFDELYELISHGEMSSVEKDICRIVHSSFQDIFISNISHDIEEHLSFGLVGRDFCDVSVIVSQNHTSKSHSSRLRRRFDRKTVNENLPSHFRLLALLKLRIDKNLTAINALLGCPIMFAEEIDRTGPNELLILVNYLIEIVNSFSCDISCGEIDDFRLIMVQRMKLIVSQIDNLERVLSDESKSIKLPTAHVSNGSNNLVSVTDVKKLTLKKKLGKKSSKSKSKGRKRKNVSKDAAVELEEMEKVEEEEREDDKMEEEQEEEEELFDLDNIETVTWHIRCRVLKENLCLCFRELDLSVYSMLADLARSDWILSDQTKECLNWKDLLYYLTDLWLKIKHCLRNKPGFTSGYNAPNTQKNVMLYKSIDQIELDVIIRKLVDLTDLFKLLLAKCISLCNSDEIFDSSEDPCFQVMELLFKILAKILHFLKNYSKDKSKIMLEKLIDNLNPNISTSFVKHILSVKDNIPNVSIASSYCELIFEIDNVDISLSELTQKFLGTKWNSINIANYKSAVSKLFEIHLAVLCERWFEIVTDLILPEMQLIVSNDSDDSSRDIVYTCLDKHTLLGTFKQVSDFTLKKCKSFAKVSNSQRNTAEVLESWEKIVIVLKSLTKIVADDRDANMMLYFIKFSREFIKIIIKNLMPILDNMFRHENAKVVQLLSGIQFFTRFVQRLCSHCKNQNNLASTSLVPQLRRYLETFMFRVKKMMCINKCSSDMINILLLANKDLHGQRIEESAESDKVDEESNDDSGDDGGAVSEEMDNESESESFD